MQEESQPQSTTTSTKSMEALSHYWHMSFYYYFFENVSIKHKIKTLQKPVRNLGNIIVFYCFLVVLSLLYTRAGH